MHIKGLLTGLIFILMSITIISSQTCVEPVFPQPSAQPDYIYPGNPPNNKVNPNELFVIESGTYSGDLSIKSNATVWIKSGASWEVQGELNELKGMLLIQGSMSLSGINLTNPNSEAHIGKNGQLNFTSSCQLSMPLSVYSGGSLQIDQSLNFMAGSAELINFGSVVINGTLTTGANMNVYNCPEAYFAVDGSMTFGASGSFENQGILKGQAEITINSVAALNNECTLISRSALHINTPFTNNGTLYVTNEQNTAECTLTGAFTNNNILVADHFSLLGSMTGSDSHLYVYEQSILNGSVGGSVNIYDATDPNGDGQIFDVQNGNIGTGVTNIPFVLPTQEELEECPQATGLQLLPVTWLGVDAFQQDETIVVEWSTAAETENKQFEVERFDASSKAWNTLGIVAPKSVGDSETVYTFRDKNPIPGINMYRIKQIDFDGIYSYSDWVTARFQSGREDRFDEIKLYPNPTMGRMHLSLQSSENARARAAVTDRSGVIYKRFHLDLEEGKNRIELPDLSHLPKGMYWLHIQREHQQPFRARFIKS